MSAVNESRCPNLNCQQIVTVAVPLAVGVALAIIGAVLTQVVAASIAYSIVGVGSASIIASLTYLAVTLCKSKPADSIDTKPPANPPKTVEPPKQPIQPQPKEATGVPKKQEPKKEPLKPTVKETKKAEVKKEKTKTKPIPSSSESEPSEVSDSDDDPSLSMEESKDSSGSTPVPPKSANKGNADQELLVKYCKQVGGKAGAIKLLKEKGKVAGAYTFYRKKDHEYAVCVLDKDLKVFESSLRDPTVFNKNTWEYGPVYDMMHSPILPDVTDLTEAAIHNVWMDYKNIAFCDILNSGITPPISQLGIIQEFVNWLKKTPRKVSLNPVVFLKLLGNNFGLLGNYKATYKGVPYNVEYEGLNIYTGRGVVMTDLIDAVKHSNFSAQVKDAMSKTFCFSYVSATAYNELIEALKKGSPIKPPNEPKLDSVNPEKVKQLMSMLKAGIPITLVTGWKGHCVNITMNETDLFFTNKGVGSHKQRGMLHYKIQVPITESVLEKILKLDAENDFPNHKGISELEKILDLKFVKMIPSTEQKAGCSTFAHSRKSYHAAALLLGVDEQTAQDEFKAARHRMNLRWLDTLFVLIDKLKDDKDAINELYFFLFCLSYKINSKGMKRKLNAYEVELVEKIKNKMVALGATHPYIKLILDGINKGTYIYQSFTEAQRKVVVELAVILMGHYKGEKSVEDFLEQVKAAMASGSLLPVQL